MSMSNEDLVGVTAPQLSLDADRDSTASSSVSDNAKAAEYAPTAADLENQDQDDDASSERAERTLSRILTNADSVERDVAKLDAEDVPIPPMGGDKPYPPSLPDFKLYTVAYDGPSDPIFPHNWPFMKKLTQCFIIGLDTFTIAFGSAIFSSAIPYVSAQYHVAEVVSTLAITLYVLGFASGPIIWAPLSELYGRRPVLVVSSIGFTLFQFAVATAKDLQTILICRFFGGFIGAAPLAVVPAAFADMFGNETRGTAIVCFSMAIFVGPMMAPILGGFIAKSYLGWRWTEYITGILGAASCVFIILFQTETHHPIILVEKAREIRRRTGNWGIHAPHDEFQLSVKEIAEKNLTRPLKLLFTEPIIFMITLYNSFIYGIVYLFLSAYPLIFQGGYRMVPGVAELPYLGLILGINFGGLYCIYCEKFYVRKMKENNNKIIPEARLPPMIVGSVFFPIGIFWLCWTGNYPKSVHWMAPTASGLVTGFGLITIFIPSLNYIIDSYLIFAASAMAGNTFMRSGFGAVFPLFATFMFKNLHTNWAGTLIGCFSVALIPVPVLFHLYGKRIRQKSKYAFDLS
ncbi:unnamed protein product [[Candida] boidinii]|uniref:Unnamed protein product n=1 Tax=Candida boidinii TaxID=5477 RepID=A0A9W6T3S6_CANBO|nr:hypothetical protein B5S30_g54 [[Candida] boidinii]OWB82040.1 hypothetical protein B5S33_g661 [[Candida] boidinii]GME73775.1 unnamed protein product [[Candida] boidinii]